MKKLNKTVSSGPEKGKKFEPVIVKGASNNEEKLRSRNVELEKQIVKGGEDLVLRTAQLDERTAQLDERTIQLGERTGELGVRTAELGERTGQLGERTGQLGVRTAQLSERTTQLGERTGELGVRTAELSERTGQLGERTGQLGERTAELGERTDQLGERTGELGVRTAELSERTGQLGDRTAQLDERTEQLGERTGQLGERTGELGVRTAELSERTGQLGDRTAQLGDRTDQLNVKTADFDRAEALNKELEAFTYAASHDLRAPLRSIDGFSLALLEDYSDKLDAEGQDHLKRIRECAQTMGQLIDDLIGLSSLTRASLKKRVVDLSVEGQKIAKQLQGTNPDRKVTFVFAEKLMASCDLGLIQIVLQNLLGNAYKYSSKRQDTKIEMGSTKSNGNVVYFIRDNGVGFDMRYVHKLFGPFQRLHDSSEFAGNGIGLATVQRVITRHGGRVWAEGEVDKGTTIFFTL